jgi:orotidine 5'-phosphate decarboxylase subfamily 2
MSFFSRLTDRARAIDSLLCVGLDPHPDLVGSEEAAAARDWCLRLVEATAPVACAFKPNSAFFEALGPEGWAALGAVVQAAGRHAPVILDAKRGDIASTAHAYARAIFDQLGRTRHAEPVFGHDRLSSFARMRSGAFPVVQDD